MRSVVLGEAHCTHGAAVVLVLQHLENVFGLCAVHGPTSTVVVAHLASARAVRLDEGVLSIVRMPLRAVGLVSVPRPYRVDWRKALTCSVPVDPTNLADLLPCHGALVRVEVRRLREPRVPALADVTPLDRPHVLLPCLGLRRGVRLYGNQVFRQDACLAAACVFNLLALYVVAEFLHEPAANVDQLLAICHIEPGVAS